MITTIRLVNTSLTSCNHPFCMCMMRTFKIYSPSKFQIYIPVNYMTLLYIRSPELTCLTTGSLYPLTTPATHQPLPTTTLLCFSRFDFFGFHI